MKLSEYLTILSLAVCILSVIVSFAFYNLCFGSYCLKLSYTSEKEEPSKWLLIGVLSAQDNYLQRGSIRDTWGRLINTENSLLKFIVGERICQVPPLDRVSQYGCIDSRLSVPNGTTDKTLFNTVVQSLQATEEHSEGNRECYTGFTFGVVHSNITIRQLGVVNWASLRSADSDIANSPTRVIIKDSATGKRLISASFLHDLDKNASDIVWKQIAPLHLTSGFQAEIGLENYSLSKMKYCRGKINLSTGLINYFDSLKSKLRLAFDPNGCHLVAFSYTIQDVDSLKRFIEEKEFRKEQWTNQMIKLEESLQEESESYGDILFVDVVDVYYNLSRKVQHFFDWTASAGGWNYILKTDDDVFVDTKKVEEGLKLSEIEGEIWDIWSCFKSGWPIPKWGKWRAAMLGGSEVYPAFPSGGGYIVTRSLSHRLAGNRQRLDLGEDVRLGILTESDIVRRKISGMCSWSCDGRCDTTGKSCNVQELTVAGVYLAWQRYKVCKYTLCQCVPANYIKA